MIDSSLPAVRPRKVFWFFVCLAILAAGFVLMNLLRAFAPVPQQVASPVNIPIVDVQPLRLRDSALQIAGQGFVNPVLELALSAQVSGELVAIHPAFKSGGRFGKGEVLLQIDPRAYQAALDEARASVAAEQSNQQLLERQLERALSLRSGSFIDENSLDDIRARRDQSVANLARLQAVQRLRALDLERATLRAPFDGYVLTRSVDVGTVVSPGQELARLYASDGAEVVVALSVQDAALIPDLWTPDAPERSAVLRVRYGEHEFEWDAYVDRVEADIDRDTRTVDVVLRAREAMRPGRAVAADTAVPASAPPLLAGMYAYASIEGMRLPGHFVLPVSAVHDSAIWVLDPDNRLRVVPVETVRQENGQLVLLAPGLPEGTRVIVSSIALANDGMQVQLRESAP
jgi:RND family efflux transporter MFP subunit